MGLPEEILELLKEKAGQEHEYINPNFLTEITNALSEYYELEDDAVDKWVMDMFCA